MEINSLICFFILSKLWKSHFSLFSSYPNNLNEQNETKLKYTARNFFVIVLSMISSILGIKNNCKYIRMRIYVQRWEYQSEIVLDSTWRREKDKRKTKNDEQRCLDLIKQRCDEEYDLHMQNSQEIYI